MSDARHSSSKQALKICSALVAGFILTGCSLTAGPSGSKSIADLIQSAATMQDTIESSESAPQTDPVHVASTKQTELPGIKNSKQFALTARDTAWCRYLINDSAAQAAILASPTLSASSDDDGNGSVNIGMNLLDFKKAELVRSSGEARCDAHSAGRSIEGSLRLVGESTKLAAAKARHNYLAKHKATIDRIVARARSLSRSGMLTVQQANRMTQERDKLNATMNTAKAEIEKRSDMPELNRFAYEGSNRQLEEATWRLQSIEQDIRTLDAFDVNVQAGYRFNDGDAGTADEDDYYAKVKLGIRLGALSPNRMRYEEQAAEARLDALNEHSSGPLWQSRTAAQSITKSLSGMKAARGNLVSAGKNASDTAARLSNADRPELIYAGLEAKLAAVSIGAEVAAADASIRDLEETQKKIEALAD